MESMVERVFGCEGGHKGGYASKKNAGQKGKARVRKAHWEANSYAGGTLVDCAECCKPLTYGEVENGHLIAEENGGHYCLSNIVLVCRPCNARRSDTDMVYGDVRSTYVHPRTQGSEPSSLSWHRKMVA